MAQKYFYKGSSLYACYSGKYLDLHGVYFVFNYSLLVKRTSRPDGYRPDCKCLCEDLYLTVQEVAMILPLAFHITPWAARSIMKYSVLSGIMGCSGRICVIVVWKAQSLTVWCFLQSANFIRKLWKGLILSIQGVLSSVSGKLYRRESPFSPFPYSLNLFGGAAGFHLNMKGVLLWPSYAQILHFYKRITF